MALRSAQKHADPIMNRIEIVRSLVTKVPEPRYKWLNPVVSSLDMGTVTGCLAK